MRITNLAPRRITLPYEAPFLTASFFKLAHPVAHPYSGSQQGQTGLGPKDYEDVSHPESPTLGGMVKSLTALARDVSELRGSVNTVTWLIGVAVVFLTLVMTAIGILAAVK